MPLAVKEAVYRVGMEALQNAIKHAKARTVFVQINATPANVIIQVQDDGIGFDVHKRYPEHLGLHTMRERVTEYGGALEMQSAPGSGTTVKAEFPLNIVKSAFQ